MFGDDPSYSPPPDLSNSSIAGAVNANPQAQAMYNPGMAGHAPPTAGPIGATAIEYDSGGGEPIHPSAPPPQPPPAALVKPGPAASGGTNTKGQNGYQAQGQKLANAIPPPAMPHAAALPPPMPPAPSPQAAHASGYQSTMAQSPLYQEMLRSVSGQ
jgi:hypothetical protein